MEQFYGKPATWTIGYGLFADKWLQFGLVDSVVRRALVSWETVLILLQIYSGQTNQLQSLLSSQPGITNFGIPTFATGNVDSNYNMMAAAYVSDSNVQSSIIARIHNRANLTASNDMIPQVYNSSTGATEQGQFK